MTVKKRLADYVWWNAAVEVGHHSYLEGHLGAPDLERKGGRLWN